MYGEGELSFGRAYVYLTLVNNASQIWAIYCLVLFYQAAHSELKPMKPFAKFVCVKAVVFFSWWQSLAIDLLFELHVITLPLAVGPTACLWAPFYFLCKEQLPPATLYNVW